MSRTRLSSLLLSGLFIGTLLTGLGLNAVSASPIPLLDYYSGAPDAPSGPSAVPGDGNVILHWHVPISSGDSPITSYIVTPYNGFSALPAQTFGVTKTTATVTGLTNGLKYTFKVAAHNGTGTGPQSPGSNLVTVGAPAAPTSPTATPGKNLVILRWFAPASNNGSRITAYVVTPYRAGVVQTIRVLPASTTTQTVSGLTNGQSYTFRVSARNARGASLPSAESPAVLVAGAPAPPTSVHATRVGAGQVRVTFVGGANNGLPITGFTATCSSKVGGATKSKAGVTSPITVTGLTVHRAYTCKVSARNGRGTGALSTKSAVVTP